MVDNKQQIVRWIQLINSPKVGPKSFSRLVEFCTCVEKALESLEKPCSLEWAEAEYDEVLKAGASVVLKTDEEFPQKLRELPDCPPLIYVKGRKELLYHLSSLAIVGSRNASVVGRKMASKLAFELTSRGILVVSGMARGIDSAAHKGAMYAQNQHGPTIAVLGTGLNKVYPSENESLYSQIAEQGLIVSELPMNTMPAGSNFPRRNRIVAALSDGVLVAEAESGSGSLITAKQALEMNKFLFAVPGSPADARSQGVNGLIKDGALLVENAEDIIKILNDKHKIEPFVVRGMQDLFIKPLDNSEKTVDISPIKTSTVMDCLSLQGVDIDEIIRMTNIDAADVSMQLVELELDEQIVRMPGNKVALNPRKKVKK